MTNTDIAVRFSCDLAEFTKALNPVIEAWKQAIDAIKSLCDFRRPGWLLVGDRAANELQQWGIPEDWSFWLVYRLPYRYRVGFVKMIRR